MAFIRQINEDAATGDLAEIYAESRARAGYVANILKLQGLTPGLLQDSLQFYIRLMKQRSSLTRSQREMLATVVSNANDCYY